MFNNIERVAAAPATMPALVVLAIAGVVVLAAVHPRVPHRRDRRGGGLRDDVPVLLHRGSLPRRLSRSSSSPVSSPWTALVATRAGVVAALGNRGLAVLAAFGVWVNAGLGILQQGAWAGSSNRPTSRGGGTRLAVNHDLGLESPVVHSVGPEAAPVRADPGDYAIVGEFDARTSSPVAPNSSSPPRGARSSARASRRTHVHHAGPRAAEGDGRAAARVGDQDPPGVLGIEHLGGRRVRSVWDGPPDGYRGAAFTLGPGSHRLDVVADPYLNQLRADVDGDTRLEGFFGTSGPAVSAGKLPTAVPGIEPSLDGTIHELPSRARTPRGAGRCSDSDPQILVSILTTPVMLARSATSSRRGTAGRRRAGA